MGLREDFLAAFSSYLTVDGYATCNPISPGTIRACDNHTMFTSEMYMMMHKMGIDTQEDRDKWEQLISNSMVVPGLSTRFPGDNSIDAPDNIVAILGASKVLNKPQVAHSMLEYGLANFGFFNSTNPNHIKNVDGTWNWTAFEWRQPQLMFAAYTASDSWRWWKFWLWPLMIWTGLLIGTACGPFTNGISIMSGSEGFWIKSKKAFLAWIRRENTPISDTDARRLTWSLIQATQDSWFCRQMAKIWFKRLYKDFHNGMQDVAGIYYQPTNNNPFQKYWVTE